MVPWQAFEVKDGHVVIAARDQKFWENLCDAMGRPDLKADPRTQDNAARLANRDWLVPIIEEEFKQKTRIEWAELLDFHDIPSAPVNDFESLFSDPHMEARGMVKTYEHPTEGPVRYQPSPMKLSGWDFPNEPAPMLGQHTEAVLTGRLGLTAADVARLDDDGVIALWHGGE